MEQSIYTYIDMECGVYNMYICVCIFVYLHVYVCIYMLICVSSCIESASTIILIIYQCLDIVQYVGVL